jgi:radical SAM/Cys-rich protein
MPYARQLCFAAARAPETRCRNGRAEIHQNHRLRRLRGEPFSFQGSGDEMNATLPLLEKTLFPALMRGRLDTLQVNLGYRCNQSCLHCHVNAGPNRTEMMDAATLALIPQVLAARGIQTLDLTGGAPELHEGFRDLVRAARAQGVRVIDRCNLTILFEPGQDGLAEFLAGQQVEVVASLPCYSATNVDRQRGDGVFDKSITALQQLNALGYGQPGSGRVLNLVYNPQGASLPPDQKVLQADYKRELFQHFGIVFNELLALTNMPIQRFGSTLVSKGSFDAYMDLLKGSYQPQNLAGVMCRSLVSVDWQGWLYDCDFNQQLDLPLGTRGVRRHLRDLLRTDLQAQPIRVSGHCYGCTAGQGSSCGGALAH